MFKYKADILYIYMFDLGHFLKTLQHYCVLTVKIAYSLLVVLVMAVFQAKMSNPKSSLTQISNRRKSAMAGFYSKQLYTAFGYVDRHCVSICDVSTRWRCTLEVGLWTMFN